jgi:hypothetical protein
MAIDTPSHGRDRGVALGSSRRREATIERWRLPLPALGGQN